MVGASTWVTAEDGTPLVSETSGEGDALVLVHSAASDARQWARLVPLLAPGFKVVSMDRRGRRRSGPLRPDHSLQVEYGDITSVVTSFAGPVHLLGHSSGARFALHAALLAPNLASLTLYEPPAPETFSDTVLEALDQLEEAGDRLGILRLFLVDMVGNSEDAFAFIQQRPIWPIMLDNALTLPAELRSARRYRFDPSEVAGLAVPTLVLVGELSGPEVVDAARQVSEALPDARTVILPGQGHGAMFTAPDLFASELRCFVESLDPG